MTLACWQNRMKNQSKKQAAGSSAPKPTRTLLDFFKPSSSAPSSSTSAPAAPVPHVNKLPCPAAPVCSELISEARMGYHLDHECRSRLLKNAKKKSKSKPKASAPVKKVKNGNISNKGYPKNRRKALLSDSDDDIFCLDEEGYESPTLFDLPEDDCCSPGNMSSASQPGFYFSASMLETQLDEEPSDTSPTQTALSIEAPRKEGAFERKRVASVNSNNFSSNKVKSESALEVATMLDNDWGFDAISNFSSIVSSSNSTCSQSPGKRKTFDLGAPPKLNGSDESQEHSGVEIEIKRENTSDIENAPNENKNNSIPKKRMASGVSNPEDAAYSARQNEISIAVGSLGCDAESHSDLTSILTPDTVTELAIGTPKQKQSQKRKKRTAETVIEDSTLSVTNVPSQWDDGSSDDFETSSQSFRIPIRQKRPPSTKKSAVRINSPKSYSSNSSRSPMTSAVKIELSNTVILSEDIGFKSNKSEHAVTYSHNSSKNNNVSPIESESHTKNSFEFPVFDLTYAESDSDGSCHYSPLPSPGLVTPNRTPSPSPSIPAALGSHNTSPNGIILSGSRNAFDLMRSASVTAAKVSPLKLGGSQHTPDKTNAAAALLEQNNVRLSSSIKRNRARFGLSQGSPNRAKKSSNKKRNFEDSSIRSGKQLNACRNLFQSSPMSNNCVVSDNVNIASANSPLELQNNKAKLERNCDSSQTETPIKTEIIELLNASTEPKLSTPSSSSPSSKLNTSCKSPKSIGNTPCKSPSKSSSASPPKSEYRNSRGTYLENFLTVVNSVCSTPGDYKLFNDEDRDTIATFHSLSLPAKKLYVRLFQRNVKWNRVAKLDYPDTCDQEDTILYIRELSYAKYLLLEDELEDLEEVLPLLLGEEVAQLCKDMKVSTAGRNKSQQVEALINNSKSQPTIAMAFLRTGCSSGGAGSKPGASLLLKRAKQLLGPCCLLNRAVRRVLLRLFTLYSLPRCDEDDETGQQQQLVTMLRVQMGAVKYPSGVARFREKDIFRSRDDLLQFELCQELCSSVREHLEARLWPEVLEVCAVADTRYDELLQDQELVQHDTELPRFLRRYTSLSLLVYMKACQVEALQRLRKYSEAVKVLRYLLRQSVYLLDHRGAWYDRLALNLDQHLKMKPQALAVVRQALADPEVRVGHRLALSARGQRLMVQSHKAAANKKRNANKKKRGAAAASDLKEEDPDAEHLHEEIEFMEPREAPKVVIEGRSFEMPSTGIGGFRRVFILGGSAPHSGEGEVTACSVEELALGYYQQQGYQQGLHAEGSTVNSLFGLLFWRCLYELCVPDAFRLQHQAVPLDLDYPTFYTARKQDIDDRVQAVAEMSDEAVAEEVEAVWQEHGGETSIVNWDLFKSPQHAVGLILSLGVAVVSAICERLARDHRFTRSGFPDLIVWDPERKMSRIVEVKGPNDRLSSKQELWLDFLLQCGACAEVCHVEAIGAKNMSVKAARKLSPTKKSRGGRSQVTAAAAGAEESAGPSKRRGAWPESGSEHEEEFYFEEQRRQPRAKKKRKE